MNQRAARFASKHSLGTACATPKTTARQSVVQIGRRIENGSRYVRCCAGSARANITATWRRYRTGRCAREMGMRTRDALPVAFARCRALLRNRHRRSALQASTNGAVSEPDRRPFRHRSLLSRTHARLPRRQPRDSGDGTHRKVCERDGDARAGCTPVAFASMARGCATGIDAVLCKRPRTVR